MELADLDVKTLTELLNDLQMTHDADALKAKYGVTIPQWLSITYRCVSCAKETNIRIQSMSIKHANKALTCPFCRKISQMFTINIEKKGLMKNDFGL